MIKIRIKLLTTESTTYNDQIQWLDNNYWLQTYWENPHGKRIDND